jgi:hypothetical protein
MTEETVKLVMKIDNIPKKKFNTIIPLEYNKKDVE